MPRLSKIGAAALAAFGWTGLQSVTVSYLVVAGGGGSGGASGGAGGGGGAGGFLTGSISLNPLLSYTVTVGAGGAGGATGQSGATGDGTSGSDSILSTITSTGGGGGGAGGATRSGKTGGSGGGGGHNGGTGGAGNTPSTSPSQGNNGGTPVVAHDGGGGGGGASAVGATTPSVAVGGAGGAGTASSISGSSVTYAGGGGAASSTTGGAGGAGGGGTGGNSITPNTGTAGTANTGGGGGSNYGVAGVARAGGSGIVIISYVGAQQFGGGVVTSSGGNTIHTFTTSGTLSPITPLTANFLVVAGGGGGGSEYNTGTASTGGGGGAGGFRTSAGTSGGGGSAEATLTIDPNSTYLVTVGAGGAGGVARTTAAVSGSNSAFNSITSIGGGRGGNDLANAATGGSGGGGRADNNGAAGTANQGFAGGNGGGGANGTAGGGGGASAVGGTATSSVAGNGGNGVASSISGASTTYGGGGGGGACGALGKTAGTGGTGGGGNGATGGTATSGTANTGGGGGGAGHNGSDSTGGAGGSGVVIISYAGATQLMAGGTVTISGGNVIHTFTSTGFLTPIELVTNSLRFRSSASAGLSKTNSASPTNSIKFTLSFWAKLGQLDTGQKYIYSALNSGTDDSYIQISTNKLIVGSYQGSGTDYGVLTTAVFRDPSAWYHVVAVVDTANATASSRAIIYVNGVLQTVTNAPNGTFPQNYTGVKFNTASQAVKIAGVSGSLFDGYMTEVNFIDGQTLTPSSFGTINSYGVWQPITYGGSFGTNGFYLPFTNTTSTTTLGYDFSPQGNNWTTNNISLTAGATYDSMTDVPTLTSATAANYCVLNPLRNTAATQGTISSGNLQVTGTNGVTNAYAAGTMAFSEKMYCEFTITAAGSNTTTSGVGVVPINSSQFANAGNMATGIYYTVNGNKRVTNVSSSYGSSYTTGDVIGVAVDAGAETVTFYKNNVSQGSISGTGVISAGVLPYIGFEDVGSPTVNVNFGQRPFTYTPPSGFVALNTFNL